jgi:probable addiction module antidote protein
VSFAFTADDIQKGRHGSQNQPLRCRRHPGTKQDIATYLDAVLEDGDPDLLKAALGDIARAKGMTEIAQAAGLGRANLYKALSPDGNPEFANRCQSAEGSRLRLSVAA